MTTMTTEVSDRQLVQQEIGRRSTQGWLVVSQTEHAVQLRKPRQWSRLGLGLFVALPMFLGLFYAPLFGLGVLGLLFVLVDYLLRKEQTAYITADELRRQYASQAAGEAMKIPEGEAARCSVCGGAVRAAADRCKHCGRAFVS